MKMIMLEDDRLAELIGRLSLEEKVRLLSGRDFWTTWPIERIGLRRILMSDGPAGVRGEVWDERDPSLNLPSGTALGASWDVDLARRYGAVAAAEARRKGVDVVLGPTINLHRSPLGGRHFEAFSEDPVLTGDLAAAYVRGLQDHGVAATPKHYVGNDCETERFTVSTDVDERTLREVYLLPFEKAVVNGGAWAIMSAYNGVNGVTMTEHELLETPLNREWGFDGVVVSDWTAVRSIESANASQDLAMPGPDGAWGDALLTAVRAGDVPEKAIDRKVLRLLLLAARVGALASVSPPVDAPDSADGGVAFAREAAIAGTVLARNEDQLLPLDPARVRRIAVIGHNAVLARTQGGGSATVVPASVVSPLDGIREAFPDAQITYALGAIVQEGIAELPADRLTNPATATPGIRVAFLRDGTELYVEDRRASSLMYFGGAAPLATADTLRLSTSYRPAEDGTIRLGYAAVGPTRIAVNGRPFLEADLSTPGGDQAAALLAPPWVAAALDVTADTPVDVTVDHRIPRWGPGSNDALAITLGVEPPHIDPGTLIAEAASAAREADVAIVVVGTNSRVESEGFDRTSLTLPGRQNDLITAVTAANPRTVLIVNAGAPVALPTPDPAAVLLTWFGGQEYGHALGDVLSGAAEPGGRLPTTWPSCEADVPVLNVTPIDGRLAYTEGIHIGYRAWLRAATAPRYAFGHGLGYTTWTTTDACATPAVGDGDTIEVTAVVTNTGLRRGKNVVQVYASRAGSRIDYPRRWLVGFVAVAADPGASVPVTISVPARALAHWNNGWRHEPGTFTLHIGSSVTTTEASVTVRVD